MAPRTDNRMQPHSFSDHWLEFSPVMDEVQYIGRGSMRKLGPMMLMLYLLCK